MCIRDSAHTDADDVGVVVHALEEADEGDVVDEGLGGGDDLDEVGGEALDAVEGGVEVFGGVEVVVADDEADAGLAEFLDAGPLEGLGGLEFEVDEVEAGLGGVGEDFDFGGDGAGEAASVGGAATGGDGGGGGVGSEELLELWEGEEGFFEVVEAELEEGGFLDDGCGPVSYTHLDVYKRQTRLCRSTMRDG